MKSKSNRRKNYNTNWWKKKRNNGRDVSKRARNVIWIHKTIITYCDIYSCNLSTSKIFAKSELLIFNVFMIRLPLWHFITLFHLIHWDSIVFGKWIELRWRHRCSFSQIYSNGRRWSEWEDGSKCFTSLWCWWDVMKGRKEEGASQLCGNTLGY